MAQLLSSLAFEPGAEAIVEIRLKKWRHAGRPGSGKDNVRASKICTYPCTDIVFASVVVELGPVGPNVFRECAFCALGTVVLAGKSRRVTRLPDPKPLPAAKKRVHGAFSVAQRPGASVVVR